MSSGLHCTSTLSNCALAAWTWFARAYLISSTFAYYMSLRCFCWRIRLGVAATQARSPAASWQTLHLALFACATYRRCLRCRWRTRPLYWLAAGLQATRCSWVRLAIRILPFYVSMGIFTAQLLPRASWTWAAFLRIASYALPLVRGLRAAWHLCWPCMHLLVNAAANSSII